MGNKNLTVAFYTLGCKVNQYESEALRERMVERGFTCVSEDKPAFVSVINTCAVTNLSDRKSRQLIRRAKKNNPEGIVAVIGCYSQIDPKRVSSMKEVDIMLGSGDKSKLPDIISDFIADKVISAIVGTSTDLIENNRFDLDFDVERFDDLGPVTGFEARSRALIKIQDGCDRNCTYCIIPQARGRIRSRTATETVREAERLISAGYRELVITGVNLALYGADFIDGKPDLLELLNRINNLPGSFRLRLGSLEPTVVDTEFVRRLIQFDKLCPSLHLSVQSGSDRILKKMGRNYSRDEYLELIKILRLKDPAFGVSTDFIVGFPGESEDDFLRSLSLVDESQFHNVHVFKFSGRPGTAAAAMQGQIPSRIKTERSKRMIIAGEAAAKGFLSGNIGLVRTVIPEKWDRSTGYLEGYSEHGLRVSWPDSDSEIGRFVKVLIKDSNQSGLLGRKLD